MRIPPYPRKGESVAQTVKELIDFVRASRVTSVQGGRLNYTPNGTSIEIAPKAKQGGLITSATCTPWKATITNTGTVGTPVWKVSFAFGTLNSVAPNNWDSLFTIDGTSAYWPTLTVTTSDGDVTDVTLSMETSPQSSDDVSSGAPPTSFKVTLGIVAALTPCMGYTENLTATATEIFKKSRASISFDGQEPFERFFRWGI